MLACIACSFGMLLQLNSPKGLPNRYLEAVGVGFVDVVADEAGGVSVGILLGIGQPF